MCFTRVSAPIKDGFRLIIGMGSKCMRLTRLSASVKTISAFSLVWRYNACVLHACLYRLRRLLRFCRRIALQCMRITRVSPSVKTTTYGVTMNAFHTLVCIGLDDLCVFLCIVSQCMRFTRLSTSVKMAFANYFKSLYNAFVSYAFLHRFKRLL